MRCEKCNSLIPDNSLYCAKCDSAVHLVPDYEIMENFLSDEVNEILEEEEYNEYYENKVNNTYSHIEDSIEYPIDSDYIEYDDDIYVDENNNVHRPRTMEEKKIYNKINQTKRKNKERKDNIKKKRIITLSVIAGLIISAFIFVIIFYTNSYSYQMIKGNKALNAGKYYNAISHFQKASNINSTKGDPLVGEAKAYIELNDYENAHELLDKAIEIDESCADAYFEKATLLEDDGNLTSITSLFEDVTNKKVIKKCKEFIATKPKANKKSGNYSEVLKIKFKASNNNIYYTLDGSVPTEYSTLYTEPIELLDNTTYVINVIRVNNKGISSPVVTYEYILDLPIIYSPDITPSTGQYDISSDGKLEIKINDIPDGYTAYYTFDGSDPTKDSTKYSSSIKINKTFIQSHSLDPSNIVFKAILIADEGNRTSDIASRTYIVYNY